MNRIPFNNVFIPEETLSYVKEVFNTGKLSGDHKFTRECSMLLQNLSGTKWVLTTTSCTHALEMTALLLNVSPGDEIVMPSFTFPSTANAFVLRGARIVFVDIDPLTMNIDPACVEDAITEKTRAIVAVHYGGVACQMDRLQKIATAHNLYLIEDAAQALCADYKGRPLGGLGDLGVYSFHETKNITCGEGGALVIKNEKFHARSEIIREKGTDRSWYFRGEIDRYSWQDVGSSYLPSELNMAMLYAQLTHAEAITDNRMKSWDLYFRYLKALEDEGKIKLPFIPDYAGHNAHIFYIKTENLEERSRLIQFLKARSICALFHYTPLFGSHAGRCFSRFDGVDQNTTTESEKLVRLPLYYGMTQAELGRVCDCITDFYKG